MAEARRLGLSTVYLTQAELAGIAEAFDALLLRYIDERPIDDVASRPAGSVPVTSPCSRCREAATRDPAADRG